MIINGIHIDDTFAEAFNMRATRVIITAQNHKWAYHAAQAMTGFATSVIGCGVEAGIERELSSNETPDGGPGIAVLMFAMGAADVVPGVSGGTIAFISGIYQELIDSINNVNLSVIKTLKKDGLKAAWKQVNGSFLLALLTGIGISILTFSKVITHLLETQPV